MPITPTDHPGSLRGKILDWKTVSVSSNQATATFDHPVERAWVQIVGTTDGGGSSVPLASISGKTVTIKVTATNGTQLYVFAVCTPQ
ncbi:MAG: hypothetical protein ACKD6N_03520 [Candidatus Bathyarchaeota archaeon]